MAMGFVRRVGRLILGPKGLRGATGVMVVIGLGVVPVLVFAATQSPDPRLAGKPRITGTAMHGAALHASRGTWDSPGKLSFSYRWLRCDGSGRACSDITGDDDAWYELSPSDIGHTIRVEVRASGSGGSTEASSDATPRVRPARGLPRSPGRRIYYVSPQGSDANPGTSRRPWRTLQRALATVEAGYTLRLQSGVYAEPIVLRRAGIRGRPITVTAAPGHRPLIRGRLKITGNHVRVTDLLFDGPAAMIYVSGADHVEISRNEVRNVAESAIYVGDEDDDAVDVRISKNYIHDNGSHWNLDHGVYFGHGHRGLIANNLIEENYAHGIKLGPGARSVLAAHNTVVGNGRSGILVNGDDEDASSHNRIANNIIANNAHTGIRTYWESAGVGADNVAAGNLAFGHPGGDFVSSFGGGITFEANNISADPLFVDANAGQYTLQPRSPAIDAAMARYRLPSDFRDARRPRGRRADVGAFESG